MNKTIPALLNKEGNLKRLPERFYYDQYLFVDYKYDKSNFRLYVDIPDNQQRSDYIKEIACETVELLVSLIVLRESLDDSIFNRDNYYLRLSVNGENIVDEATAKSITKWCKKWGYPFQLDSKVFANHANKLFSSKMKLTAQVSFSIADFLYSLNELYCLFRIYLVLIKEDTSIKDSIFISEDNSFIDLSTSHKSDYQKLFEAKYNLLVMDSFLSFSGNEPYLQIKARSLFDVAMYQLARLTYNRGIELRRCKMCNKLFYPTSGRQKYCYGTGCYPQL